MKFIYNSTLIVMAGLLLGTALAIVSFALIFWLSASYLCNLRYGERRCSID